MYKRLLIVTFTLIGLCTLLTLMPIHGESAVYDNVLRLHVLANSDSEEDQQLKLCVRDGILEVTENIFSDCKSREEAERLVTENMSLIQSKAQSIVRDAGYSYPVSIALGKEEYPTKNYESACFPAGEYMSLRVMIGEAEGQNWWCVLFPPMCVGAASQSNSYVEVGLTGEQYNIITETDKPKYKIRFKLLEAIDGAVNNS
ncbi:MAG: stage II sporulation protein R [Clostridia bacterium]|nr:stage II sporulation protein R [Clostridia bacterium]